jgi:Holliday junction resolvase RusA-like endonuclease
VTTLTFAVRGLPAPQGSKRHIGRGVMVESSKRVKPWREAVRTEASIAMTLAGLARFDGPLVLEVTFYFDRPRSHYRTGKNAHLLRDGAPAAPASVPDLSKLVRSTEDALTDAGVWVDDSRVVLLLAGKRYTGSNRTGMPTPGAEVRVRALVDAVEVAA